MLTPDFDSRQCFMGDEYHFFLQVQNTLAKKYRYTKDMRPYIACLIL